MFILYLFSRSYSILTILLILLSTSNSIFFTANHCRPEQFECKSGDCINSTSICNHISDCPDGGDEKDCDEPCPDGWFHCLSGQCILLRWRCDGVRDCSDHSDELNCGQLSAACTADQFRCHDNSKCLPLAWVCDGTFDCKDQSDEAPACTKQEKCNIPLHWYCDGSNDCADASDELNCTSGPQITAGHNICPDDGLHFYCADRSECLDVTLVCNGIKNCNDGSDEGGQCDEHTCKSAGCSHGCFQTPIKAVCLCLPGYELPTSGDGKSCKDIDECQVIGSCSQQCVNTDGSYTCNCIEGYHLQDDRRSCRLEDPEPILIYSASRELKVVKLRSGLAFSVHGQLGHAVGVDYDSQEDRIYWSEIEDGAEAIKSSRMDGSDTLTLVTAGISVVEDVAFDWIGRNIYLTDSGHQRLVVCGQTGINCHVLLEDMLQPRALVLDPTDRFVFWSDWSHSPAIERAGMDGSNRRSLVSENIGWPNGLTIDFPLKCLYWVDGKIRRVESINFDGTGRRVVLEHMMLHPFSLVVLEDTFYWTDWSRHTLESCNKFTGSDHKVLLRESGDNIPMGLHAYHPVVQQAASNPCWLNECAHMCLLSPDVGHRCVCRQGYVLSTNGKSCSVNATTRIFMAVEDTIYEFQEAVLGRNDLVSITKATLLIGAIAYDFNNDRVVYSDMGTKQIVSVHLNTHRHTVLMDGHMDTVQGLAIDWISGNLYWTDSARRTLEVSLNDGNHRRVLVDKFLGHPMDIALLPIKGFLFVALIGNHARIEQVDMDGTDRHVFIDYEVSSPVSLIVDHVRERLYWVDLGTNKIEWASLDGKHRFAMKSYIGRPSSVSVTNDFIWWTDSSHDLLLQMGKETGSPTTPFHLMLDDNSGKLAKLLTVDLVVPKSGRSSGCGYSNGQCSHLCLSNKLGFVCSCPPGMQISSNHRICEVERKCNAMEFTCGDSKCIPLDFTCDSVKDCLDGSDEVNCERPCSDQEFRCGNAVCIPVSWMCDHRKDCIDNSDEMDCNRTVTCPAGMFACTSGECMSSSWKCDSEPDCSDSSDEKDCIITCVSSDFHCKSGQCIPGSWRCDGETDCRDGSDEDETCITQLKQCNEHEMTCDNGRCIEKDLVCDNDDDCGDGSDERQCEKPVTCPGDYFRCGANSKCVPSKAVCDGVHDCPGGEDEVSCAANDSSFYRFLEKIPELVEGSSFILPLSILTERGCDVDTEFQCPRSRICVSKLWLCDGENDCDDAADEQLPQCHHLPDTVSATMIADATTVVNLTFGHTDAKTTSTNIAESDTKLADVGCLPDEYKCSSGSRCIALTDLCNHRMDCPDNSDEGSFCATTCDIDNGGCSDVCFPTPSGAKCWCRSGFELHQDKTCHDIDECGFLGACSHQCHNVPGTYVCSCASGYHLRSDHRSCKAEGPVPHLLLTFPTKLLSYTLGGNHVQVIVQDHKMNIKDVAFDAISGDVYWIDYNEGTLFQYLASSQTRIEILQKLESPSVLAYDWITRHLVYWESSGYISVCTLDGRNWAKIFKTNLGSVSSMTLDPIKGIIYWSSWSDDNTDKGIIESVYMNGKRPNVVVSGKMIWPCGLNIDFIHDVLYWVDVHLQVIESIDLNTNKRQVVSRKDVTYPMSLALFEDRIYWADWGKSAIMDCDRWTCQDRAVLLEHVTKVHKLAILHPVQQPKGTSPCSGYSKCSHICVTAPRGYGCLCPEGMHFTDKQNTTCAGEPITSRSGDFDRCTPRTCLNNGRCFISRGHPHCVCQSAFSGKRCENRVSRHSTVNIEVDDADDDHHDSDWFIWLLCIILLVALLIVAFWYFRPDQLEKFRGAFAPIPFQNSVCDEDGNPLDDDDNNLDCLRESTTPDGNSYLSYSNPLFETCHGGNLAYNSKDRKVEFHVSGSSVSLDSAFVSETPSGTGSGCRLIDLPPQDKLLP